MGEVPPKVDDIYTRSDGARIRVDRVANGQVYYVAWRASQEIGCPKRMPVSDWWLCIGMDGMALVHNDGETP